MAEKYRIMTSLEDKRIHLVKGYHVAEDYWRVEPKSRHDVTDECIKAVIELFNIRLREDPGEPIVIITESKSTGKKFALMFAEVVDG